MAEHEVKVGCAGWSIPSEHAGRFDPEGSHLARYARRLPAVEINSSFYRPHRPSTYARWATETPEGFAFSVKVPKEITHRRRLVDTDDVLARFLEETEALGTKRGPLLVQLPPSLAFDAGLASAFFSAMRRRYAGPLVCEPRHRTWFGAVAEELLREAEIARVAADPAVEPQAAEPGGWGGLVYYRLHGSPQMYYSEYPADALADVSRKLVAAASSVPAWCIFDNTAQGHATTDALSVLERTRPQSPSRPRGLNDRRKTPSR